MLLQSSYCGSEGYWTRYTAVFFFFFGLALKIAISIIPVTECGTIENGELRVSRYQAFTSNECLFPCWRLLPCGILQFLLFFCSHMG